MTLTSLEPCHHLPGGSACVRVCVRPGRNWHVSTHISTHIKTPCCRQKQCVCASLMTALCSEWIRQRLWVTIHSLPGVMGLVTRPVLSGFYAYTYTCRIEIYRYPNTVDIIQSNTVSSQLITYWSLVRTVLASLFGAQGTPLASLFDVKGPSLF